MWPHLRSTEQEGKGISPPPSGSKSRRSKNHRIAGLMRKDTQTPEEETLLNLQGIGCPCNWDWPTPNLNRAKTEKVCLSMRDSVYMLYNIYLSISSITYLSSIHSSVNYQSLHLWINYLSIYHLSIYQASIHLTIIDLSIHLLSVSSIHLSINLFIYHLSIHVSLIYPSIYLTMVLKCE